MATSIIKPVHAGIDYSFTIPANGWTSVAPYTYTWTNSSVTSGCRVEVAFFSGAEDTDVNYLEYEKVSGGIQFTSPVLPTVGIPVVAHIINAQTGNTIAVNDELVSSTAITGAANVNEALTSLSNNLSTLETTVDGKLDASKLFFSAPINRWGVFSDTGFKIFMIRGYYTTTTANDSYLQAIFNSNDKTLKLVRKVGSGTETTLTTWTGT